jgi:hypothetical protein
MHVSRFLDTVGDHRPPQALGEPTAIYPHCIDCMHQQGNVLQHRLRAGLSTDPIVAT